MTEPCDQEVRNNTNSTQINGGLVEAFRNGISAESEKQNVRNENCTIDFLDANAIVGSWNMDVDNHSVVNTEKEFTCKNVAEKVQQGTRLKMVNFCVESDLNGMTDVAKVCPNNYF